MSVSPLARSAHPGCEPGRLAAEPASAQLDPVSEGPHPHPAQCDWLSPGLAPGIYLLLLKRGNSNQFSNLASQPTVD